MRHTPLLLALPLALALAACGRDDAASDAAVLPDAQAAHAFSADITADDFDELVKTLASDEFGGRAPGTDGEEKTVEYIRAQFERIGLQPGGDNDGWYQTVPMIETTADPSTVLKLTTGAGGEENPGGEVVTLPLFGEVDLQKQSLLVSTLLIAFVDGVNPCSIWVLTMLLALTLHTGSRKKVLLIGLIFLTVTAGIYALFITGLFTVLKVLSFTTWIRVVVALVSLFFARLASLRPSLNCSTEATVRPVRSIACSW